MTSWQTLAAIGALIALYALPFAYGRWRLQRDLAAIRTRVAELGHKRAEPAWPDFVVRVDEAAIVATRPDGTSERVEWAELERVAILTTADGPFAPDVFWLLVGKQGGCLVPWGCTGDGDLLERLQRLPGFDSMAVVQASGSSAPAQFACWTRPP